MGCVRRLKYFVKNIYGEINAFIIRKYVFVVSRLRERGNWSEKFMKNDYALNVDVAMANKIK